MVSVSENVSDLGMDLVADIKLGDLLYKRDDQPCRGSTALENPKRLTSTVFSLFIIFTWSDLVMINCHSQLFHYLTSC